MVPPNEGGHHGGQQDEARPTDYGADVAATESQAASVRFDLHTGPRIRRAVSVGAIVLGVLFIAVCVDRLVKAHILARDTAAAAGAAPLVDVVRAQPVGATERLLLPGQTAAWHSSTIYARVNGYVGKWFVDIGDHVRRGQVLARIETPDLDAQLAAARAQLQSAQAQLQVRRAEAELGKTTFERWRDSPPGVVSEQEREEKRADFEGATARLKSAQAEVALDQARVNQYAALAEFKQVTAPYDGTITTREIDIGNLVTAGSTSATTLLYVMTQNDPMRIFVDVPQSAAADLMVGNTAVQVQTGAGPGRDYQAHVTRTSQALNPQARTLRVEVDIDNPAGQLVPGMYVKVAFGLPARGLVQVPAAALLFRASGPQVARVERSGRIAFRPVTIGRDDGSMVELSAGVDPGDLLALNVSSQIGDGDAVRPRLLESDTPAAAAAASARR